MQIRSLDDDAAEMTEVFVAHHLRNAIDSLSAADSALEGVLLATGRERLMPGYPTGVPAWIPRMRRRVVMLRWLVMRVYARVGASYGLMPKRYGG